MTDPEAALLKLASPGTPKLGHACHRCEDWGTLVVLANVGPGVMRETEIGCPEPVHQVPAEAS